jgi:hypothetical protein
MGAIKSVVKLTAIAFSAHVNSWAQEARRRSLALALAGPPPSPDDRGRRAERVELGRGVRAWRGLLTRRRISDTPFERLKAPNDLVELGLRVTHKLAELPGLVGKRLYRLDHAARLPTPVRTPPPPTPVDAAGTRHQDGTELREIALTPGRMVPARSSTDARR